MTKTEKYFFSNIKRNVMTVDKWYCLHDKTLWCKKLIGITIGVQSTTRDFRSVKRSWLDPQGLSVRFVKFEDKALVLFSRFPLDSKIIRF
jgi:hypothetical protein